MSQSSVTASRRTLAQAVNEVFAGSNQIFSLAQRLLDIAEELPANAGDQREKILKVAADLGSSAQTIVRGQQSAVDAISRKTVL